MGIQTPTGINGKISGNEWKYEINLKNIKIKPENIKVKIDEGKNLLAVSGKMESEKELKNGGKMVSSHVWSHNINIPQQVEQKTISSKIKDGILIFTGKTTEKPKPIEHQIPIQMIE